MVRFPQSFSPCNNMRVAPRCIVGGSNPAFTPFLGTTHMGSSQEGWGWRTRLLCAGDLAPLQGNAGNPAVPFGTLGGRSWGRCPPQCVRVRLGPMCQQGGRELRVRDGTVPLRLGAAGISRVPRSLAPARKGGSKVVQTHCLRCSAPRIVARASRGVAHWAGMLEALVNSIAGLRGTNK